MFYHHSRLTRSKLVLPRRKACQVTFIVLLEYDVAISTGRERTITQSLLVDVQLAKKSSSLVLIFHLRSQLAEVLPGDEQLCVPYTGH